MDKNFERELPKGYKLAHCLDIKSGSKSVRLVMLLSLALLIPGCIFVGLTVFIRPEQISKAYGENSGVFILFILFAYSPFWFCIGTSIFVFYLIVNFFSSLS